MYTPSEKIQEAFKEACKKTGRPEKIDLSIFPEDMQDQALSQYMLMVITEAKNDGWKADWNDPNQKKWFPYIWFSPSGVRFNYSTYSNSHANAGHAARLCFQNKATSEAAGIELLELYEIALNK